MSIIRVVDQYNFPHLLRELGRAVRGGDTNIAALVDRANTFVCCISMLPPGDRSALVELSKKKGMEAILARPRDPERAESYDLVTMGTFTQYLSLINDVKELGPSMLRLGSELKRVLYDYREHVFVIQTPSGDVELGRDTRVMGVLNATPDSFSDGGKHDTVAKAVAHAKRLEDEGAAILDVGGESTRPGAEPVPPKEEQRRVVPVIEALVKSGFGIPICVDTRNASTAEKALAAGAAMVNDVSGLRHDPEMAGVVGRAAVPVVLVHSRGSPQDMAQKAQYHDLLAEVLSELRDSMLIARNAGVELNNVILDPGLGFAKTPEQSMEVLRRLGELRTLGRPLLVGPSRKSFLEKITGAPVKERDLPTSAAVAAAAYSGAHLVRVHAVAEAVQILKVVDAVRRLV